MHLVIVGKSAFSRVIGGSTVPISVAGHTVQLIRPLISYARARHMSVSYIYPLQASESDCLMVDPADKIPDGVVEAPFTDSAAVKSSLRIGWLSVEASLRQAIEKNGKPDWVVVASAFPLAAVMANLKEKYGFKLALFIRGYDGYKWLDPGSVAGAFGDVEHARQVCDIYRDALLSAEFIGVASQWLGDVVAAHGGRWDMVVESPAATGPAPAQGRWTKERLAAEPGVARLHGDLDPSARWLISAGRLHREKRLDLALDMFSAARLPGWQLVFSGAGAGTDGALDEATRKLLANGEAAAISVPPRIVHALFEVSDAYLQTSLPSADFIDARPSSVTSAAFHGKPVIVPLAEAGGVTESVAAENVREFGFDVRHLDPATPADRAEIVRRGARVLRRLDDAAVVTRVGRANAEQTRGASAEALFDRVWSRLSQC
jgi:glycosyltransferase involved in cell wall biosynthesis